MGASTVRPETIQRAALHARTRAHQRKAASASALLASTLAQGRWAVSFSGGKDSTVALDLVHRIDPSVPVVWSDEGLELPESLAFQERTQARVAEYHHIASTEWWGQFPAPDRSPGPAGKEPLRRRQGWDGYILGLRGDESIGREFNRAVRGLVYQVGGAARCQPIAHWSVIDVWSYILIRGLDYNAAYDRMDEIGIPLEQQRVGPVFDPRALAAGSMEILRAGWPEQYAMWSKLQYPAERHPAFK